MLVSTEQEADLHTAVRILERDVPKIPRSLLEVHKRPGDAERVRGYLKELVDEKEKANNRNERERRNLVRSYKKIITAMANHQCKFLYNDIQADSTITRKDLYWKDVFKEIRTRHIHILERATERIKIRISECVSHWVAETLFRKQYEHHYNPKKEKVNIEQKNVYKLIFVFRMCLLNRVNQVIAVKMKMPRQ